MKNPFQYGGIVTGPYFADRSEEIKELSREMENNNRIFLVSQRRFGKTCLLHHLKSSLEKNGVACTYVDLNAYPDLRSLAGAVAGMATRALESNTDRVLKIFSGFRRLRPKLGIDGEGHLSAGLEVAVAEKEALSALMEAVAHIGELAAKKKKKTVIIIDEFSDIEKYDGGTVEKALRSEIQKQSHIGYIFSGSEESVMLDMVQDRKRAFYKLGRLMRLGPIRRESYIDFISGWLAKGGFRITTEEIVCILDIGEDVPYNIQRLCHTMWEAALEAKTIDSALVERLPVIIARQAIRHPSAEDTAHCAGRGSGGTAVFKRVSDETRHRTFVIHQGVFCILDQKRDRVPEHGRPISVCRSVYALLDRGYQEIVAAIYSTSHLKKSFGPNSLLKVNLRSSKYWRMPSV